MGRIVRSRMYNKKRKGINFDSTAMKTTIKVNIAGYSFTVEEDAYFELEKYLSGIRESFSRDGNAEEIVRDIEERIAELLNERCSCGTPVGINAIMEICGRIGRPEELAEEKETQGQNVRQGKRLYRDTENRVIGGVCSGLGIYFNTDKVLFRLIFIAAFIILFTFVSGSLFCMSSALVYICLWIAMPAARTVEDKCRMKGKPISLSSFRDTPSSVSISSEAKEIRNSPAGRTAGRIIMSLSGIIMTITGFAGLLSLIFIQKVPELARLRIDRHIMDWGTLDAHEMLGRDIITDQVFWWFIITVIGTFCIWMLYNGIRFIFDLKPPSWKPGAVLFVLWIISILATVTWVLLQVSAALPSIMA